jgi:hypothetical protein
MNTSSDRHLVQLAIEEKIGCFGSEKLPLFVDKFEAFSVGSDNKTLIDDYLNQDMVSCFKKGALSLFQGISGLESGRKSWALIKLYYSIFYFLRASLAADGCAVVRCKSTYMLDTAIGSCPEKKTGNRFRSDHIAVASIFIDRFADRDILMTQNIEDKNVYEWMRDRREWINYRRRDFIDDDHKLLIDFESVSILAQVELFCTDTLPIYCFDPDFAALALPIKRALLTAAQVPGGHLHLLDCFNQERLLGGKQLAVQKFMEFTRR